MPYTPDAYDNTKPVGAVNLASSAPEEFRAIKTVLLDHRDRIVDLETEVTAQGLEIDAINAKTGYKNKQWLTGSGDFTVPAGVTKIKLSMRGGSRGKLLAQNTTGGFDRKFKLAARDAGAEFVCVELTVVPAAILAYAVGADSVVAGVEQPSVSQGWIFSETTAATASSFDTTTAAPGKIDLKFARDGAYGTLDSTILRDSDYFETYPLTVLNTDGAPIVTWAHTELEGAFILLEY